MSEKKEHEGNKKIKSYLGTKAFFKKAEELGVYKKGGDIPVISWKRLETRTRKRNSETALSFRLHDPLWMLTRQWQFGEFKGDDAGSPIGAKIKIEHRDFSAIFNSKQKVPLDREAALEYFVERMNAKITPAVRVESAFHLKKSIDCSALKSKGTTLVAFWQEQFPLMQFPDDKANLKNTAVEAQDCVSEIKTLKNNHLKLYIAAFGGCAFDGFKVFNDLLTKHKTQKHFKKLYSSSEENALEIIIQNYLAWFKDTYIPVEEADNFWNPEEMGYDLSVDVTSGKSSLPKESYSVKDYGSGRLSWYSFDQEEIPESRSPDSPKDNKVEEKLFSFLPVQAEFLSAPDKRLWAFEDAKVSMGNSELTTSDLASALVLEFTTMYGNDWFLTPMELEVGKVSSVTGIIVTDVFGTRYYIDTPAGDMTSPQTRFSGKWEMFTIAQKNAYEKENFTTNGQLFFPPALPRTEESNSIEEIQFLRDEMANMVWGVEKKINDGVGGVLDGDNYAADIDAALEKLNPKQSDLKDIEADYRYLFQNKVPVNWIPFSPVKVMNNKKNALREIRLQRSTMPLFVKDQLVPIRPSTRLLRTGIDDKDRVNSHKFIKEGEVLTIGTKVMLNHQRARWFNGKSFNWIGARKEISRMQANSGLAFDKLIELVSKNAGKIDI